MLHLPHDNVWDNLAVLCRNCHGMVTAKGNMGSNYTPGEVLRYKRLWEKRCAEAAADDIESPAGELHETKLIEGGDNEKYVFDMEDGDELVFSIEANDYLDGVICEEEDIEAWSEGDHDKGRPLPDGFWHRTGIMEGADYSFVADESGRYVLLLVNWDDDATEVTVDAAVWATEEYR